jgi:hypothetical protein
MQEILTSIQISVWRRCRRSKPWSKSTNKFQVCWRRLWIKKSVSKCKFPLQTNSTNKISLFLFRLRKKMSRSTKALVQSQPNNKSNQSIFSNSRSKTIFIDSQQINEKLISLQRKRRTPEKMCSIREDVEYEEINRKASLRVMSKHLTMQHQSYSSSPDPLNLKPLKLQLEIIKLIENYCEHILNMENSDCVDFDIKVKS